MASIANYLMSDDNILNAEYDKHPACIVRTAGELHEKLLRALHRHDTLSIDTGDLSEFLRLFADDLKELIGEASHEARELLDKAEMYDEHTDAIGYWSRIYDETPAVDADDVIEAFSKADKLDYLVNEIREFT